MFLGLFQGNRKFVEAKKIENLIFFFD